jgi:regulator of sigma E protease
VTTLLSFVVVIGVLILIHELGHFFVARWTGVGVERFSIGFGPVLLRWRGRETEYCLSAIPLGGYVKMMGEESPVEGGGTGTVDPARSFSLKPLPARFLIVFAGPAMNLVLAAAIFAAILLAVGLPAHPTTLGRVKAGGPAAEAGLRPGDRVTAVDGVPVAHWEPLLRAIRAGGGETRQLTVVREGREVRVAVTPARATVTDLLGDARQVWEIGAEPLVPARIEDVIAGEPAAKAGLRRGDVVVALEGVPVQSWDELTREIRRRAGVPTELTVEREGRRLAVSVVPQAVKERGPQGEEIEIGRIGVSLAPAVPHVRPNPVVALVQGAARTWETTALTVRILWKLVTGQIPASNIGGPIQIAVAAGEAAQHGLLRLAGLTAVVSVNLAVLNLLPVPMLDGGHLLYFVIEGIRGRPLSIRKREVGQQVGLLLLLSLVVFATYNDLERNWSSLMEFLGRLGSRLIDWLG